MHKAEVAEWVLSLVVRPERAAAIVGDLMEGGESRGRIAFWSQVAGAFVSTLWSGVAGNPRGMIGLAFRGLLVEVGFAFLYIVPLAVLQFILYRELLPEGAFTAIKPLFWIASLAAEFQAGKWLARRAPDRELSVCVSVALAWMVVAVAEGIAYGVYKGQWSLGIASIAVDPLWYAVDLTALFAGAILVRRKSLRVIAG